MLSALAAMLIDLDRSELVVAACRRSDDGYEARPSRLREPMFDTAGASSSPERSVRSPPVAFLCMPIRSWSFPFHLGDVIS